MLFTNDFFSLQVEKEVERLQELKSIKMKELLLKKKLKLEEICRKTHLTTQTVLPGQHSLEFLDYGKIFPKFLKLLLIISFFIYWIMIPQYLHS